MERTLPSDLVNTYFRQFYPPQDKIAAVSGLHGMRLIEGYDWAFPRMQCSDGFNLSVQAHYGSYCQPRESWADEYSSVEVGYPSEREDLLMPYVEDADRPTDTVYGYVPVSVIEQVIAKHGGLVEKTST